MAGGSADAGAALRLLARAAGRRRRRRCCARSPRGLGADVPAQVAPGARAWRPARARRSSALPGAAAPTACSSCRRTSALSTADVFREADRLGLARDAAGLADAPAPAVARRAARPARRRCCVNDLEPAALSLLPGDRRRAGGACARAGADIALVCGQRPDRRSACSHDADGARAAAVRAVAGARRSPTPVGAARRRGPPREARLARRRGRVAGRVPRLAPAQARADAARRRRDRRRRAAGLRHAALVQLPNLEKSLDQRRRDARPVDLPARRRAGVPRDRRVHRPASRRARRRCSSAASSPARARSTSSR